MGYKESDMTEQLTFFLFLFFKTLPCPKPFSHSPPPSKALESLKSPSGPVIYLDPFSSLLINCGKFFKRWEYQTT